MGGACREAEIGDGEIEREMNCRAIWVAEKSHMRVVMMLLSSLL
jgi:hypothetical protein